NTDVPGKPNEASLLILNEDLELLETIEFGEYSYLPQITGFIGDRLYFSASFGDDGIGNSTTNQLRYFSISDSELHTIWESEWLLGYATIYRETLFVARGYENIIYEIDATTGTLKAEHALSYEPDYFYVSNDILYVAGYDYNVNGRQQTAMVLAAYALHDSELTLLNKIYLTDGEPGRPGRYYLTGLFANN
ncbi:MAG: hypothetical protein LBU48_07530, partial [Coriobacteriales bacterium]|nr:hypothetical protein [Coriobacteriales bacterium]